jgi:AcrR family transcriptional regulator
LPKVAPAYLEERRRSIIVAATRVFSLKGVEAATMADVAEEAGITAGAIYRYFPGKRELADRCFSENAAPILGQWMQEPPHGASPLEDLHQLAEASYAILNDPIEHEHTLINLEVVLKMRRDNDLAGLAEIAAADDQVADGITRWITAAQESGELGADLNPSLLARALMSLYWGARLAKLMNQDADTNGELGEILKLMNASARLARG